METLEIVGGVRDHARTRRYLASQGFGKTSSSEIWSRVRPAIIPSMELNKNTPANVEACAEGLKAWAGVVERAIITTVPGQLDVYAALRRRIHVLGCCHPPPIIPGLKTNHHLRRGFDNVDGWTRIGEDLSNVAQRTGSKIVLLENESAIKAYANGRQRISLRKMEQGLGELPADLTIWWYPAITGSSNAQLARMARVCRVVAAACVAKFVDLSRNGPAAVRNTWSKRQRKRLLDVVNATASATTIPMMYFYGPGSDWWMYEQIHDALGHVADARDVIVYPGGKRWLRAAKAIGGILESRP